MTLVKIAKLYPEALDNGMLRLSSLPEDVTLPRVVAERVWRLDTTNVGSEVLSDAMINVRTGEVLPVYGGI